jgi:hypothetical protein
MSYSAVSAVIKLETLYAVPVVSVGRGATRITKEAS